MTLNVDQAAPNVTLTDSDGQSVDLAEIWRQHPLALFFVRHFG